MIVFAGYFIFCLVIIIFLFVHLALLYLLYFGRDIIIHYDLQTVLRIKLKCHGVFLRDFYE